MAYLRTCSNMSFTHKIINFQNNVECLLSVPLVTSLTSSKIIGRKASSSTHIAKSTAQIKAVSVSAPPNSVHGDSPVITGLEDVMMGYIFGKKKATEVAHSLWEHIVKKGDTVIDATCGNGHDTLAMLKMVADATRRGRVYGMDVQKVALENTSTLLGQYVTQEEKELVELFSMCHSNLQDIVPDGVLVRLVAFNLGYLPGGNKKVITKPETTRPALEAAKRILASGGLISILVYVGHDGGREELETVQAFATGLPVEYWTSCKLEMLNRPYAPVLVLIVKR